MASAADLDGTTALVREAEAYLMFEAVRWPGGPSSCPHCKASGHCRLLAAADGVSRRTRTGRMSARRVWRCGHCRRQFSVLTGTVFERTKVPLAVWLDGLGVLSEASAPHSVGTVARTIGVSADTARWMVHLVHAGLSAAQPDCVERQPQG